jgi:glycosyltransferase involved in cell wall biosynthesis
MKNNEVDISMVVLLTNRYPFPPKEDFLETELPYLSKEFKEVHLLPVNYNKSEKVHSRLIPDNIFIRNSDFDFGRITTLTKVLSDKQGLQYLNIDLKKVLKKYPNGLLLTINWIGRAVQIRDFLEKTYLNRKNIDDIVFYSYWLTPSALALAMLKEKHPKIKAISRAHGGDVYAYRHNPSYLPLQEKILESLDRTFTISNDGLDYLSNLYPNLQNSISISRLGTKKTKSKTSFSSDNVFRIVTCSYIVPVKRLALLIEALKSIKTNIHWTHIGDGPIRENMVKKADEELPENIQANFIGSLKNSEIYDYYKGNCVDLFINVSESEGIPVTIMEAFSFGIPVIATDVGGTKELVNNKNGILVHKDVKPEELALQINHVIELSLEQREELSNNAFNSWNEKFNAEKNYTEFACMIKRHEAKKDE